MKNNNEEDVFWEKVNDVVTRMHDDLAVNIRDNFNARDTETVRNIDEFSAGNFTPGDFVITGTAGDQSVWILLHPAGKCLLMAGQETEDIEWFFRFGAVDIIRN